MSFTLAQRFMLIQQNRITEMVNTSLDIKNKISESNQTQRIIYHCARKHKREREFFFPLQKIIAYSVIKVLRSMIFRSNTQSLLEIAFVKPLCNQDVPI